MASSLSPTSLEVSLEAYLTEKRVGARRGDNSGSKYPKMEYIHPENVLAASEASALHLS